MSSSSRPRIAALAVAAVAASFGGGIALAAGGDGPPNRPPWNKRCPIEIRAHEDGSASLYCAERSRAFGAVDAENGRVRFFMTR
jgi:hypothetical protein